MRRRSVEKFLFRYDKEPELQQRFSSNPAAVAQELGLTDEERDVLARCDVVTLHRWGLHALLIRNYAGFLKLDYVAEYKKAGL